VPRLPAPIAIQEVNEKTLTKRTPEAAAFALGALRKMHVGPLFTPPKLNKETIVAPGFSGGVEWGGMAASPQGILYANSENIVWSTAVTVQAPPAPNASPGFRSAYRFSGYNKFMDHEGYPATAAPWGTLNAIDMNTGQYLWRIPFGEYPELVAKGMKDTGSENYGGPIVTSNGLLFIASTIYDRKMRVYDSSNGKLLWETVMPFAGTATPAMYMIDGKQFVTIGTSSQRQRNAAQQGAAYITFALPD
jgi:glucose dehydrogenase